MINKTTEQNSPYNNLEKMSVHDLLININRQDQSVAIAVESALKQIETLTEAVCQKMKTGGRLFYIGSGTSGRLGVVDASECPPTFGVEHGRVVGIIAGGDAAIRQAQEFAEDNVTTGWEDLMKHEVSPSDIVIGLSASGTTPYVTGAMEQCRKSNITTGCITCNLNTPLALSVDFPVEVIAGPEFVTGSTRMKAGTAQKMVLNMISTTAMIQMGRVLDNKMVDMQLTNEKLIERGAKILMRQFAWDFKRARAILLEHGSVRKVIDLHRRKT